MELLTPDLVERLREALLAAGFDYDGVAGVLGPVAHAALSRNETTPGVRATGGGSPLETLTRLWPLQASVELAAAEAALPGLVDPLCNAGLLERSVGSVRARVDVRPYADDEHDCRHTGSHDARPRRGIAWREQREQLGFHRCLGVGDVLTVACLLDDAHCQSRTQVGGDEGLLDLLPLLVAHWPAENPA